MTRIRRIEKRLSKVAQVAFDQELNGTAAVRALVKDMGLGVPVRFRYAGNPAWYGQYFEVVLDSSTREAWVQFRYEVEEKMTTREWYLEGVDTREKIRVSEKLG